MSTQIRVERLRGLRVEGCLVTMFSKQSEFGNLSQFVNLTEERRCLFIGFWGKRNFCDFKPDFCDDLSMGLPTIFRPFCGGQFEANFWPILWTILAANLRPISSLLWWPTWGWFLAHCGGQFEDYFWPISGPLWQQFEVNFRPISGLFYGPLWRPISGQFLVAMALLQCVLEVLCHPDWRLITTRFWRDTAIAVVKLVLEVRRESEFGGTSRRHRQARVGGSSIAIFGGSSVIAKFGGQVRTSESCCRHPRRRAPCPRCDVVR